MRVDELMARQAIVTYVFDPTLGRRQGPAVAGAGRLGRLVQVETCVGSAWIQRL
jgi:hypothetical protein